ncbi:MAG: toll/interleukin-1 receptor domain-containing protein [Pseudomonadales bacterium]|jgi:hypothetical protein|nr:toll/interleukin-1 receptor domain-containing protein [Pseudomonadales bacterium]
MKIYISSSWKNRDEVRKMANRLRKDGHKVYDFTDPATRKVPEMPPEEWLSEFDPKIHKWGEHVKKDARIYASVMNNQEALRWCDLVILLLPCGCDAHADWAFAVGLGKASVVVGQPKKGGQTYTQLWADKILDNPDDVYEYLRENY